MHPYLQYCSNTDRQRLVAGLPAQDVHTTQYASKRKAFTTLLGDNMIFVRVLFSAGGYTNHFRNRIALWNAQEPKAPIILMEATKHLFGESLSQTMKNLCGTVQMQGTEKVELALKKIDF